MDTRVREAIRYLGYGKNQVDSSVLDLIFECMEELSKIEKERIISKVFPIKIEDHEKILCEDLEIISLDLAKNLDGCEKVIFLAATLGIEVDRLLKRYSISNMAKVVVLQACAAARLEYFIDECQEELRQKYKEEGFYLRPRYSPGYGDFSVTYQSKLLGRLNATKEIGVSATESSMLTPTKSVTALIGLSRWNRLCKDSGCETCKKSDCNFRKKND